MFIMQQLQYHHSSFVQFVGRIVDVERSNKNCCRAIEEWGRGSWTLTSCCAAFLNYTLQIGVRPKIGTAETKHKTGCLRRHGKSVKWQQCKTDLDLSHYY